MNRKTLSLALVIMFCCFAAGRYTVSKKIETKEVEHIVYRAVVDASKHVNQVSRSTTTPDGTTTTETHTVSDATSHSDALTQSQVSKEQTITPISGSLNISLLAAVDLTHPSIPTYGLSFTKTLIGPLTFGGFGFLNGTAGMSLGVNF